jgi:nanoRNase/pAp phosphatase (c-di-AMP/oligoRNAs hydrolase)
MPSGSTDDAKQATAARETGRPDAPPRPFQPREPAARETPGRNGPSRVAAAKETEQLAEQVARKAAATIRQKQPDMTAFVESCVETAIGRAVSVERGSRHRPRARRLLKTLAGKKNILITTHQNPDPDALASSYGLYYLLRAALKDKDPAVRITYAVKGSTGGGYNRAFLALSEIKPTAWEHVNLADHDAILLLDVQPNFKFSPLPPGVIPTAVIDHHRARGRRPKCDFCDIRTDVGATSSIIFSYFMELEIDIPPDLAAILLYAIETDLAGAAGQPGDLDNMALSSLTLIADTRKLYKMRYVDLPQSIYTATAQGLASAVFYDKVMFSHLETLDSSEAPAVIADFLLRYEGVQWVLVTALSAATPGANGAPSLVMSLRTAEAKTSAADLMRRLLRGIGEGGGHRTKAGGSIPLKDATTAEIDRARTRLRKRLLRALGVSPSTRGQRLVPREA